MIGVQADYASDSDAWIFVEAIFTIIYTAELAARFFAFGTLYFCTKEGIEWWNMLDIIIVVSSIADLVMQLSTDDCELHC